jgi:hypothetical protein
MGSITKAMRVKMASFTAAEMARVNAARRFDRWYEAPPAQWGGGTPDQGDVITSIINGHRLAAEKARQSAVFAKVAPQVQAFKKTQTPATWRALEVALSNPADKQLGFVGDGTSDFTPRGINKPLPAFDPFFAIGQKDKALGQMMGQAQARFDPGTQKTSFADALPAIVLGATAVAPFALASLTAAPAAAGVTPLGYGVGGQMTTAAGLTSKASLALAAKVPVIVNAPGIATLKTAANLASKAKTAIKSAGIASKVKAVVSSAATVQAGINKAKAMKVAKAKAAADLARVQSEKAALAKAEAELAALNKQQPQAMRKKPVSTVIQTKNEGGALLAVTAVALAFA